MKPLPVHIEKSVSIGDIIHISTAHTFQYGYWKHCSTVECKVEKVTAYKIIGRHVDYPQELISVTEKGLSSGFMTIKT